MRDPIWAIRTLISRLEEAKDKIVASFGSPTGLDAKEAYYGIVLAWEQLRATSEGHGGADNVRWILDTARSRARQCESALGEQRALRDEFSAAFAACERDLSGALEALAPRAEEQPPPEILVLNGADEYQLLCSVCGALSWTITRGKRGDGAEWLKYAGICGSMELNSADASALFGLLRARNIGGAHKYINDKYSRNYDVMGIDAYCPECRTTYCRVHYNAQETFDEGFYDCTYGVCPKGHKRLLND
jgi:hypothetical protein